MTTQSRQNTPRRIQFVLGTAQLGIPYGAANATGMPTEAAAIDLIKSALEAGVSWIDTARAYGVSEQRIGLALAAVRRHDVHVVTKLDPLQHLDANAPATAAATEAAASVAASCLALGHTRLNTLLLHRAAHRTMWDGAVWQAVKMQRDAGRIRQLGVSVQSPSEALAALDDPDVMHLQLPFNLLDRRWHESGVITALRGRPEIVVHVRSALLQGLLTGVAHAQWPAIPGLSPSQVLAALSDAARSLKRDGLVDLSIAFVRAQDWINGVVIGTETARQLAENLAHFVRAPLSSDEMAALRDAVPHVPDVLLDPAQWPAAEQKAHSTAGAKSRE